MKKNLLLAITAALLSTACFNEGSLVTNPAPLMQYQYKPTEASLLALAKNYAEAINSNLQKGRIHPGLYADYGVALAQLGCDAQANVMFNNEKTFFPNSTKYVDALKQKLLPAFVADNRYDTSIIDLKSLDTIHVTLTPEELAAQQQLLDDPEYQRQLKQHQQEEKAEKAQAAKKAKAEAAKAKESERKAQALAKEKAQKDKAKAKKQAAKEKESAKRAADKEKAQAKKQAAKDKADAKKAAEKEKADAKKAADKAKADEQKAKLAAEKAEQKAQAEALKAAEKEKAEAEKAAKKAQQEAAKAEKAAQKAQAQEQKQSPNNN